MTLWCHGWCCKPMLTDCIPHPYQMYLKCLSTFICCEWAYGCNLRLLFYRCGPINLFWKIGVRVRLKQMTLWCHGRGWEPLLTASHIHIRCVWSVWVPSYDVDGHMGQALNCDTHGGMGKETYFCYIGVRLSQMTLQCHGWACKTPADCIPHPI